MNALTRDLADLVKIVEAKADGKDCFRQKLHLMHRQDGSMIPMDFASFTAFIMHFFNIPRSTPMVV